jgi:very-short-patch-repair endonuclease
VANENARRLRKTMTPQEVKLWARLRQLRELGHHFRRQSPSFRTLSILNAANLG